MKILQNSEISVFEEAPAREGVARTQGFYCIDILPKFEYINAETVEEAVFLLQTYEYKGALLAGGQDLLRQLKTRVRPTQPTVLINIKSIKPALSYVHRTDTGLAIGSLTTLRAIESSPLVQGKYSLLARAAHDSRPLQYRTVATVGGDLCQQVRCWYYRASGNFFFCRRKGGSLCYATEGDNRYHSIFGGGSCMAYCPSDLAPALAALNATVKIVGGRGERRVPVEQFFTTLGNVVGADELVTEVEIPEPKAESQSVFVKFGLNNVYGPPMASVAVVATLQERICTDARIVLGIVSPTPWRAKEAEQLIVGQPINDETAGKAAQAAIEGARPLSQNAYKTDIVATLVKRSLIELAG